MVFIDFEKAFDNIHRDCIWTAWRKRAVPEKIICIIRATYEGTAQTLSKDEKYIARKAMEWNPLISAGRRLDGLAGP